MPFIRKPIVDQWYQHLDKGNRFRVVAVDEDERTVEVQDFDGDVEEIALEDWYAMNIETIEPPEDWSGPMDDIERDDLGYTDTDVEEKEWNALTGEQLARRLAKREDVQEDLSESGDESE